jgi:lipopolysaccharide/colanic/teichoic acid biosynthesis glycosyltransferase
MPLLKIAKNFLEYIFDALLAALLLVILSPLMLVIAWRLARSGTSPVFFVQTRVGRNGKNFKIIKFRTMRNDATKDGPFICTSYEDPRITEYGKFLRQKKLDELPQLLNVLMGDMRFVGPRPEIPHFHEQNLKNIPNWEQRITVKPGITGFAQIHPIISHNPAEKIVEDLKYIQNKSFLLDLQIMFDTFRKWLSGRVG